MTKKTKLILLIPVGAVILNGLGYLVALNLKNANKTDGAANAASEPAAPAAIGRVDRAPEERSKEERIKEEKAMARRAAGMAALEAGDYERALADFAEARALAGDRAYVSELLRVTEDLAHRPPSARRPVVVRAAPPPPPRPAGRFRIVERSAPRESAPPSEAPPASAPAPAPTSGLLLVTTTPRGLLVQVDEVPVDLTPTRASLKIGPHHVALFDGDRKIYETNVDVKGGAPTTLLRDLSSEVAPPRVPAPAATAFAKEDGLRPAAATTTTTAARAGAVSARIAAPPPTPPAALADRPPSVAARTPARRPSSSSLPSLTGGLEVTSPGLYGEIWINGRPWGFPPLQARDLPPGPTRVAVRVNGVEERTAVVSVKSGRTTTVELNRRQE
jgi:hypothetical protein